MGEKQRQTEANMHIGRGETALEIKSDRGRPRKKSRERGR